MLPESSYCNRTKRRLGKSQNDYFRARDLSSRPQINRLTGTRETIIDHRNKRQELLNPQQLNPKATLATTLKSRATHSRSPATQVPFTTHSDVHINNPRGFRESFRDFCICAGKWRQSCYPNMTWIDYSHSQQSHFFRRKKLAIGPDSLTPAAFIVTSMNTGRLNLITALDMTKTSDSVQL